MSVNTGEVYQDDPLYRSMIANFQRGEWETGFSELNELGEKYPLEHDLLSLRKEMQLRADVDEEEKTYSKKTRRKRVKSLGLRLLIGLAIVILFIGGFSTYNNWFQDQYSVIQQGIETDRQEYELKTNFDHVQQLLEAYRPGEAMIIIEEIREEDPNYPGLDTALERAQSLLDLDIRYSEAVQKKADGDLVGAIAILDTIEASNPGYQDVTLQIRDIQRDFSMTDLIDLADTAVRAGNWGEAVAGYEEVRNRDPLYETEIVEERLYFSYLNAAQEILDEQPDSMDALETAQVYYIRALSLRPQDKTILQEMAGARESVGNRLYAKYIEMAQQILVGHTDSIEALRIADGYFAIAQSIRPDNVTIAQERTMAQAFLVAQSEFYIKNWEGVISNLRPIYEIEPDYAGGTARQTLYDAFILLGDYHLRSGKPQLAMEDYQNAVAIAELRPDARIRLFESMVKIGDVMGVIGNYQAAVYQYRSAMDLANINEIVILNLELVEPLNEAEEYVRLGRYKQAYSLYNGAMEEIVAHLDTVTHVVESGDYLTKLANYYNTTTTAILIANNIGDPNDISIGKRIIIPVIP
jgi:tetratricopeptide (TPR) repeat protein